MFSFFPMEKKSTPDVISFMLQQLIQLLPENLSNIPIGNKRVQVYLQEMQALRLKKPPIADDKIIFTLLDIYRVCKEKQDTQTQIFVHLLSGFISNVAKKSDISQTLKEFVEVKIEQEYSDSYSIFAQAWHLGTLIPIIEKIPDDIVDKETYIKLINHFKLAIDPFGPNPFEMRKINIPENKQIDDIQELLKQDLVVQKQRNQSSEIVSEQKKKEETAESIPKLIHLIWLGGELPEKYYQNVSSWKEKNPDYDVVLYIDHLTAKAVTQGEKNDFVQWCAKHAIHLIDIEKVLGFHPMYVFLNHEAQKPNYGAASDIARYLLMYLYGGVYFDVPDAFCKAKLPEWKSQAYFRIFMDEEGELINNDFICVSKKNPYLKQVLNNIEKNYLDGYFTLLEKKEDNLTSTVILDRDLRRMRMTLNLTGVNNIIDVIHKSDDKHRDFFSFAMDTKLLDSINFDMAGTWIQNKKSDKEEKAEKADKDQQIMFAITDMLEVLRFNPSVLDLDKYPIFSDIDSVKIALYFMEKHFPDIFSDVINIHAYNTRPSQDMIAIILDKTLFPEGYDPFQHIVCKTYLDDNVENQKYFFSQLVLHDANNLMIKDRYGNTPFLSACRQGNVNIALYIATTYSINLVADRNDFDQSALDMLYGEGHQWDSAVLKHYLVPLNELTALLFKNDKEGVLLKKFLKPILLSSNHDKYSAAREVINKALEYIKHDDIKSYLDILKAMLNDFKPQKDETGTVNKDDVEMKAYIEKAIDSLQSKALAPLDTTEKKASNFPKL